MIPTLELSDNLMVSAQPELTDLEGLAALGIKTVICNRPDGEQDGQPSMDAVASVLAAQDIRFVRYPVNPNTFPGDDLPGLATEFDATDGKVLAFCRTGTRSANLWILTRPADAQGAAFDKARSLGIDVSLAERHSG